MEAALQLRVSLLSQLQVGVRLTAEAKSHSRVKWDTFDLQAWCVLLLYLGGTAITKAGKPLSLCESRVQIPRVPRENLEINIKILQRGLERRLWLRALRALVTHDSQLPHGGS